MDCEGDSSQPGVAARAGQIIREDPFVRGLALFCIFGLLLGLPAADMLRKGTFHGLALFAPTEEEVQAAADQTRVWFAYEAMAKELRDPASAQFSELAIGGRGATATVCGKVNARNGFGGMAGPRKFIKILSANEERFATAPQPRDATSQATLGLARAIAEASASSRMADALLARADGRPLPSILYIEATSTGGEFALAWDRYCARARPTNATAAPLPAEN